MGRVVPDPGAAGDGADGGPRQGVQPAAQAPLRVEEGEPDPEFESILDTVDPNRFVT